MPSRNSIYISYRRGAEWWLANVTKHGFRKQGIDVFLSDASSFDQFETVALPEIQSRPFFMPILSPHALTDSLEQGDWFQRELESAITHECAIVPLYDSKFDFAQIDKVLSTAIAQRLKAALMFELNYVNYSLIVNEYLLPFQAESSLSAAAFVEMVDKTIRQTQTSEGFRLAADPENADSYLSRALREARSENWQASIDSYTEALRLDPKYANAYANRGVMRLMIGDADGAIADLEAALALTPDDDITRDNLVHAYQIKYQS